MDFEGRGRKKEKMTKGFTPEQNRKNKALLAMCKTKSMIDKKGETFIPSVVIKEAWGSQSNTGPNYSWGGKPINQNVNVFDNN